MIISFDPPLPCSNRPGADQRLCGQPATAGLVERTGPDWRLMPICRECTQRWAALYERTAGEELQSVEPLAP
jgi:hypothetical protein